MCFLTGCDQGSAAADTLAAKILADKSVANMISVQGGEFLMGDFGPLVGEKLPFSINQDDKKSHRVVLSDFSISKFKVTNANYLVYLNATGKEKPPVNILANGWAIRQERILIYLRKLNGNMLRDLEANIYHLQPIMVSLKKVRIYQAMMS